MALKIPSLSKENCTTIGDGPKEAVLLAMLRVGLGAAIHSLPAIYQMIQDGYAVTVNCREFQRPIFEAIGAHVITIREPFGISWFESNKHLYGRVVSLAAWDIWECQELGFHNGSTMQEIADILGTSLPDDFSWIYMLGPQEVEGEPYILFAPIANERWRSLPKSVADDLFDELQLFGKVIRLDGDECPDWQTLLNLIYNAASVVSVESGVSNIAGALGKKMLCLTGMTEVKSTVEQYRKYLPELTLKVVQGFQPNECSMPCYRQRTRGFFNDRCLGKHDLPQCLLHIDRSKVLEVFSQLTDTTNVSN